MIAATMRRAQNVRRRIWVLPGALGITTVLAASFFAAKFVVVACHATVNGHPVAAVCTTNNSGKLQSILSSTGKHINGHVSGWLVTRPVYSWSIGASKWYWVVGIVLSIVGSLIVSNYARRNKRLLVGWILAGISGVIVVLVFTQFGLPIQIVHLLAVCTVVCVAAFGNQSRSLAVIAAVSFGAGAVLSLDQQLLLPSLNVWIAPPSQGYVAAGMSLILGSIILYLQTRSLNWLPWRQSVEPVGQNMEQVL